MELPELTTLERLPPQNLEAEMAVLGSMLLEEEALAQAAELLEESDFYSGAHRKLFAAILELYKRNVAVDLVTVTEELRKRNTLEDIGGPSFLATLTGIVPTAANVEHYCRIVKEKAILRSLITASHQIVKESYEGATEPDLLLDRSEQHIFEIASKKIRRDATSIKELIKSSIETIDTLSQRKGFITGIPTGFSEFDQMTAGLQAGELIIVAGRPAMGKSSFALCIAEHVALVHKTPVVIFTFEMSKDHVVQRMLCSHARVNAHHVRTGMLSKEDWVRLTQAAGKLSDTPIFVEDEGLSIVEVRGKVRRLKKRHGVGLVILDYMQMMEDRSSRADSRQQEVAFISRGLKGLARELNIPVIAVSQLSRAPEQRDTLRPRLSDLRESGSIEQDADVVVFLFREEYYKPEDQTLKGMAEVIVAKQRNGPTGTVKLTFLKEYTRFETLAQL